MKFESSIPDWIVASFRIALLGEIYSSLVAIAVGYNIDGSMLIRYYLDREPSDFDEESIEVVATNFDALGGRQGPISRIDVECVGSVGEGSKLDSLSGFIYYKRFYSN